MGTLFNLGPGWSRVSVCLKAGGLLLAFASSVWAGDHKHAKVYVPVVTGYAAPTGFASAPVGQPMVLYPVGAAPMASYGSYGMAVSTVASAPVATYMMPSTTMASTVANAPQATIVQVGSAPAATTTTAGGVTWTVGNAPTAVGNAPTAVGTAPPAAPAEAHLKDEGKRMDVFNDLKDAYPAIRAETPDSRVNRRIKMTAEAKKLFAAAIGSDFNAESPDEADQTDIDQMVSAVMKADPYYGLPAANGAIGAAPVGPGAAPVYYMYPPQPQVPQVPLVPLVPIASPHHHHHLLHKSTFP